MPTPAITHSHRLPIFANFLINQKRSALLERVIAQPLGSINYMVKGNISNTELIDNIYNLAGEHLEKTITDWANYELWRKAVDELDVTQRVVYLIGILNQQVINGGFMQYFDNSYGIFGYETLRVLQTVGAKHSAELLEQALKIVNQDLLSESEFAKYIAQNIVQDDLGDELDKLDNQYYELENSEDLEEILANWIKTEPNKTYEQ